MPEAPEVRLTIDFLNKVLQNNMITEWTFCGGRYADAYPEGYEEFDAALPLLVEEVCCKGKFIYFILSDDEGDQYYIMHSLMMTGRWQKTYDEHCKWFVEVDTGVTLWFHDVRAFATLRFTSDDGVLQEKLDCLGPDIMSSEFKLPLFKQLAKKWSTRNICAFLMDQSVIAGCGNYIKAEVLYDAGISPLHKIGDLSDNELDRVYQGLCVIPRVSYNNKGLSLRDFADENGKPGFYERELKVYGKRWAKRTKTPDGRTTYWSPDHQFYSNILSLYVSV